MMLQRFEVTLESFLWSNKVQGTPREVEMKLALAQAREEFVPEQAEVSLQQVFTARSNLARVMKINAQGGAIDAAVKDVRIGRVPDRGGRVDEASGASGGEVRGAQRNAQSTGPQWRKREGGSGGRGGGYEYKRGGGRGGGRGGAGRGDGGGGGGRGRGGRGRGRGRSRGKVQGGWRGKQNS
jgi:protein FAM98B